MTRQRGVAMVMVLWALVLLGAVAVSYATTVRSELRIARNHYEQAQAALLAEAGVERALFDLRRRTRDDDDWVGRERRQEEDEGKMVWSVRNAAGLVDLNAAGPALLDRLLAPAVPEEEARRQLVDAIRDWRDENDLRRLDGAEETDYRAAGREFGPRNGPFAHPVELLQVLGMTPAQFEAIRPFLTAAGGGAGINPRYAPRDLLVWLRAGSDAEIEEYVAVREREAPGGLSGMDAAPRVFAAGTSDHYRIEAEGRVGGAARARLTALWRATDTARGEGHLVAWDWHGGKGGDDGD